MCRHHVPAQVVPQRELLETAGAGGLALVLPHVGEHVTAADVPGAAHRAGVSSAVCNKGRGDGG